MASTCQLLLRGLDGRTSCLRFPSSSVTGSLIQKQIAAILRLPTDALLIITGTTLVHPHTTLSAGSDGLFPSCSLLVRLRGGKGGFGSLLRGAATKAGQKKTSNFDACRDMSGRRLRHVNAEKKLKEWKAQAKERELEKAAKEFLKKQVKHKEDDSGCSQVIEKFQEETSRAREDVESAVLRGLAEAKRFGKRKVVEDGPLPASSSKRAHIWLDSEIDMVEDDERDSSDDDDVDDNDDDDDDTDAGSDSEDSEEGSNDVKAEEGSENAKGEELSEREKSEQVSKYAKAEGGFEAEKQSKFEMAEENLGVGNCKGSHGAQMNDVEVDNGSVSSPIVAILLGDPELQGKNELGCNTLLISDDNGLQGGPNDSCDDREQTQEDINFNDFHESSELEVLGLERLKHELQKRGLKCGGSLTERAGRLFLLKTIPLEKLDKKHFVKARG